MIRLLLSLILILASAAAAPAQVMPPKPEPQPSKNIVAAVAIELPPDQTVSSKQRSVKIIAKTAGVEVKWIVFNAVQDVPVDWDAIDGRTLRVYPNDLDDLIVVFAYTTINGAATDAVRTTITVRAQQPTTPTSGQPPGPSPGSGKVAAHISFIVDVTAQKPETAQVLNDAPLQKFLSDNGVKLHSPIDVKSDYVTKGGLSQGVTTAGGAPCAIVQDAAGNIIAAVPLTSAAAVREMVKSFLR